MARRRVRPVFDDSGIDHAGGYDRDRRILGLDGGISEGGDADGDKLTSIEHVIGSALDDRLYGGAGDDRLEGGDDPPRRERGPRRRVRREV